jgi:hypothetical protein
LSDAPGAGNLILAKVERMHIQEEYLAADGQLDTQKLDLVGRMGGSWYTRSSGDSLFEIPKPVRNKGIGVDRLPTAVVNSVVLTGNNLGRLGNLENIPTAAEMEAIRTDDAVVMILSETNAAELVTKVHQLAQKWLEEGKTQEALALLFSFE